MFRRKLQALEYHSSETLDIGNPLDLRAAVVWLEDQKIRHYRIEERGELRKNTGEDWTAAFRKYLQDLECPYDPHTHLPAVFDWLLGVAIRYEYEEAAEENPDLKAGLRDPHEPPASAKPFPQSTSTTAATVKSPLDIDPHDATFVAGVQALAKILQVAPHPEPAILLEATRLVIEEKLAEAARMTKMENGTKASERKERQFNVTPQECGFDLGDPALDEAAKVLRLLHIQELRHLQTHINELIVTVQHITANPKTDQSLGKVGR